AGGRGDPAPWPGRRRPRAEAGADPVAIARRPAFDPSPRFRSAARGAPGRGRVATFPRRSVARPVPRERSPAAGSPQGGRRPRPIEPLPPGLAFRLQRAVDLRLSGLPERARDTLLVLMRERPHHAAIVTELARAQIARQDWLAVERLASSERSATRDSALAGEELSTALERLGRPRDALRIAVEAWTSGLSEGAWAAAVVFRLA